MFITLADTFNIAFLWVECDLWGERQDWYLPPFHLLPHSPCCPPDNTYCNPQTTVKLDLRG